MRSFNDNPATRTATPILVGIIGPSGTGKTYSSLRLATGIQRVSGGDVYVIDTESRRSLHYADTFKFRHVEFGSPFSPLDYLSAIEHCVSKGAKTIVVDSMSHEHEGPGGVLEMHEAEMNRLGRGDPAKAERMKMFAWAKPKSERRRLINTLLQMNCNFIFCFRAKEKLKVLPGREPVNLGFQPIAGEEFVYEMTMKCLLLPGANGFPSWDSEIQGEKAMIKLPEQFRQMFSRGPQLSEDVGAELANWAAGSSQKASVYVDGLIDRYASCGGIDAYRSLEEERKGAWGSLGKEAKERLKTASDAAQRAVG